MARIFITGSADGLGMLAAKDLIAKGHQVVVHGRNAARSRDAINVNPGAESVVTGDLSHLPEIKSVASQVNGLRKFDAIIHNAGVYQRPPREILLVNVLAPYMLTVLIEKPKRLIYLSSGMQSSGHARPDELTLAKGISYSDSKLYVLMLALAIARKWPDVYSNALDPGWVPTIMGGHGAPDKLQQGYETQVWLAISDDQAAMVSGHYFFHRKIAQYNSQADDITLQENLLKVCGELTAISLEA
jgi:NAD(P)-dependent dehydrogenase (short-subunit alcohol dehydrogenase family)